MGGLATGLSSYQESRFWVGWPGIAKERVSDKEQDQITERLAEENCLPVSLSSRDVRDFYHGFCNKTIWPLFHYFSLYTVYENRYWRAYQQVNEAFCKSVLAVAQPEDHIWIHDYHLMLLPDLLRMSLPDAAIGFFLHIPFPSFELFRLLPWRGKILRGLLGADLVGFHTYDYVRHFLSSTARILGFEHSMGSLAIGNRVVKVDAFPIGIDYQRYSSSVENPDVKKNVSTIRKQVGERKIIVSIDRLDYSKGIIERVEAFDLFLSQNRQYKEQVTLILLAVPSRTGVEQYMELRRRLEHLVGRINGEHGTIGWVPIWYLYRAVPFERLIALYSIADVALVTPLRDGMNLIAKEFVATKTTGKGVLVLSEMTGAASELGESVIVNARDKAAVVAAIKEALEMPEAEQIERNRLMQQRLSRYTVHRWAQDFLDALKNTKEIQQKLVVRKLGTPIIEKLLKEYAESANRLILLDYDGTLVGFAQRPERAGPDAELLKLLQTLSADEKNEIAIISGRNKNTIDDWLGNLRVSLVAEHGAWLREKSGRWRALEHSKNEWKKSIRTLLELYTDRTPGSFIEEKDFSLVWHFRRSDPELARIRQQELRDAILNLTENLDLGVYEGSKILEVKSIGVNKARAAQIWLDKKNWDFILAAGDDYTDEAMFGSLPEEAYSIKIGYGLSTARFNLDSVDEFRALLKNLAFG